MLNSPFFQLAAPKREGKQDFLKRCMDGDEKKITACTAEWNKTKLAAFVDENELTLAAAEVKVVALNEGDTSSEPRRFAILAHTGKVIDFGWHKFIIDLSGMKAAKDVIPALLDHDRSQRLGVIDTVKVDKNGFYVMGKFLSSDLAQGVLADTDEGFPFQASIGVTGTKVLNIAQGNKHKVNGITVEGPIDVWLESEVTETSFVTFGADDDTAAIAMQRAGVRDNPNQEVFDMKMLLKALAAMGLRADATDEQAWKFLSMLDDERMKQLGEHDAAIAELKQKYAGAPAPAPAPVQAPATSLTPPTVPVNPASPPASAPAAALSGVEVITLQNEFSRFGVTADDVNKVLGDGNMTMDQARAKLLKDGAATNPPVGVGSLSMGADETDKFRLSMSDGLQLRLGMQVDKPASGHERFRAMSLHEVARVCLQRAGVRGVENLTRTQVAEKIIKLSLGGASTSDFANVFMDVTNKRLLKAYVEAPATYDPWVNEVPASDFKTIYGVSLSNAPDMKLVGENGEYETANLSDHQESYVLGKYGIIIPLSLEMIVNDDLRAFARIPQLLGASARRKVADTIYGKLTGATTMSDGKALFHADHSNLETVSGNKGLVDSDKLSAARSAMRKQTGLKGETLDLTPSVLLVPTAQETSAEILLRSTALPDADMSSGVHNPHAGKLQPIAEPRLDAVSEKAWYVIGDKNQIDTMELAFLDGQNVPTVTEFEKHDTDSIQYKGRIIFGVGVMDFRGFRKNPGE